MSLYKTVAIVTGGVQGIGRAIVETLLEKGAKVCIADLQAAKGEALKAELEFKYGLGSVIYHVCDVTSHTQFESVFQSTRQYFGSVNLLVNNAGIVDERDDGGWELMIKINLVAVIMGTKLALKYMGKDRGFDGGYIINIASMAGLIPFENCPVYDATKHGVVGFTKSFGTKSYFDKHGVRINTLCPAFVQTQLLENLKTTAWIPLLNAAPEFSIELDTVKEAFLLLVTEEQRNGCSLRVSKSGIRYEPTEYEI